MRNHEMSAKYRFPTALTNKPTDRDKNTNEAPARPTVTKEQ